MEIHHIEQDYRRKEKARIDRLRRVQKVEETVRERKVENTEKDQEDKRTKLNNNSGKQIADRYEVQKHMEGQHIGSIDRLRSSLNEVVDEKEAIKKVQQTAKMKQAMRAYGKSSKNTQTSKDEER